MSTRCQVGFYKKNCKVNLLKDYEALLYHHCDGYPENMIPDMAPLLINFNIHRGINDLEYAAACLITYWKIGYSSKSYVKKQGYRGKAPFFNYLSVGICSSFHGDIDYFYAIYDDGIIEVYRIKLEGDFDIKKKSFILMGTTSIDKLKKVNEKGWKTIAYNMYQKQEV